MNKFIFPAILFVVFLKGLTWLVAVPIWQAPDEQAHFAELQNFVEQRAFLTTSPDLSQEIAISEQILGTRRDKFGNNKYTYHPEYNIPYSQSTDGLFEKQINNLPLTARTKMAGQEAARYPPLYYLLAVPLYESVYKEGLINRLFIARILSLLCSLVLVAIGYWIGKHFFQNEMIAYCLALMVAFHPMISFIAAGFHPDNLLNVLYSLALLISLLILKNGLKIKYFLAVLLIIIGGLGTKWLMYLILPLILSLIVYKLIPNRWGIGLSFLILFAPVVVFAFQIPLPFVPVTSSESPLANLTFINYLQFRLPKLGFEIWPWYWGVFKWLGVTLQPVVLKIITRMAIISGVGLAIKIFQILRYRNFSSQNKFIIFFLVSNISYLVYLLLWDFRLMQSTGYSAGLQGRYFFPNIIPQMALMLIGLITFTGTLLKLFKIKQIRAQDIDIIVVVISVTLMIGLNLVALIRMLSVYYSLDNFHQLIIQLSQYKPPIFKGSFYPVLAIGYLFTLLCFFSLLMRQLIRLNNNEKIRN